MSTTYDNLIEQITQSVFSTMLGLELARVEGLAVPEHEALLATVHIAGAWTGSVVLGLSQPAALASAAAMLQLPDAEVTDADRRDVAAELVNMIGGNLKSVLPGPSFLSLPTIISGKEFGLQVRDGELLDELSLACHAGPLTLRLYAKLDETAPNAEVMNVENHFHQG